jgi:hypothetical protein
MIKSYVKTCKYQICYKLNLICTAHIMVLSFVHENVIRISTFYSLSDFQKNFMFRRIRKSDWRVDCGIHT